MGGWWGSVGKGVGEVPRVGRTWKSHDKLSKQLKWVNRLRLNASGQNLDEVSAVVA